MWFIPTCCPLEFTQPQFDCREPCNVTFEPPVNVNLKHVDVRSPFKRKGGNGPSSRVALCDVGNSARVNLRKVARPTEDPTVAGGGRIERQRKKLCIVYFGESHLESL